MTDESSASPAPPPDRWLTIDLARPALERAVRRLARGAREVELSAGTARDVDALHVLVADDRKPALTTGRLRLTLRRRDADAGAADAAKRDPITCYIDDRGELFTRHPEVARIRVIGAGLHQTPPANSDASNASNRWSRIAGALGATIHARLRATRFAVVGCGRTGSLVASTLARMGVADLTLIDPDGVELHNLDAMDGVHYTDLGRTKVHALADHLRLFACGVPHPLPQAVTTSTAIAALRATDFVCCCVDEAIARLATTALATLFLKPLLDIGVGIRRTDGRLDRAADVRLILPGERRCLFCFGGIAERERMLPLIGGEPAPADWRARRAGSLRSLNQIAAHLGVGMIEDLAAERLDHSQWLRLRYAGALPGIEPLTADPDPECPICALAGNGDAGLLHFSTTMRAAVRRETRIHPPDREG
ncbi:MAG: ThiF family adenylyltransferase [Candidatus Competibacteraceae bacterium]|nr:MAG: ThiF family adenylyltransferase [Candidatus Competibacteraceae bacterium]